MSELRRIRSPNYPALDLREAVQRVSAVFERERQHPMSKEVALKGMGYSGVNGAALGTLSAVTKYGLLDKSGDVYRVSDRAISILHPNSPSEKEKALRDAAFSPPLFAELAQQFPGGRVSDDNLRSYLMRNAFSSGALPGVIKAFRATMEMVSFDQEEPSDQALLPAPALGQAAPSRTMSTTQAINLPAPAVSPSSWVLQNNGQFLTVHAQLDNAASVDKLIRVLEANKLLLPDEAPDDQQKTQGGDSAQH